MKCLERFTLSRELDKILIEAMLFASEDPVPEETLLKLTGKEKTYLLELISELSREYEDRAMEIVEVSSGKYVMRLKGWVAEEIKPFLKEKYRLPRGMLRVLALIAYKEGVTKKEVASRLGKESYKYIKRLEEMGLISSEPLGRTSALHLTERVKEYFGLSPQELKEMIKRELGGRSND